jgi:hypothetical protein
MAVARFLAAVAVPAVVVASSLSGPAPTADARPVYSTREKKPCGFCHTNPRGGGPRTEKGAEYEKNGMKFPGGPGGPTTFGEDGAFKSEANGNQFAFARAAFAEEHWSDALRRIADLKGKEPKKGPGYQKVINLEASVDQRGRDLVTLAKQSIEAGKVAEAAEALARVESEFRGREPAKDVAKWRGELAKLPGGKEADAKARADQPQRLKLLDAQMKSIEGDTATAKRILEDLIAKHPDGPFTATARTRLEEWKAAEAALPPEPTPAPMGG